MGQDKLRQLQPLQTARIELPPLANQRIAVDLGIAGPHKSRRRSTQIPYRGRAARVRIAARGRCLAALPNTIRSAHDRHIPVCQQERFRERGAPDARYVLLLSIVESRRCEAANACKHSSQTCRTFEKSVSNRPNAQGSLDGIRTYSPMCTSLVVPYRNFLEQPQLVHCLLFVLVRDEEDDLGFFAHPLDHIRHIELYGFRARFLKCRCPMHSH